MEAAALPARLDRSFAGAVPRERVASLVLRYFYAATAVLFVAGLLGLMMRQSQANLAPLSDNFFYAVMTAHGLGAFVAWAGFAVMGFGFWVLQSVGFLMRPVGFRIAAVTWWLMVLGTLGIVVSTVVLGFGGSWVFLYPLPFYSSGQWGDFATFLFSFSVLLAGLAIVTWCVSVLHTALGPSLHAASDKLTARAGAAMGLGLLWPRRFPLREGSPVPYAVIPLVVIAIDMIIATLPLAVLLIEMCVQSFSPSVTVDPLLAKNVLWWFGHPVVYLLLFPAVALYYLLIPRYAGRELVAGRIIAVAWLIGVIVNVTIWAHHVYLDYPQNSPQGVINVAMQPLTFSIAIVSALSLYSLSATIWRSRFEWTPGSKFLVAGMFGWLTAGLSGLVNATIRFDVEVHNTLWVVGHFHHMALLNIGLVVFAAGYAFLPELTGKHWYSARLADWHLWTTLVGGYGAFFTWLVQGLVGAPRRYALLPERYDVWTVVSLPFVALMAIGQLIFLWNLACTLRGLRRERDERSLISDGRQLGLASVCAIAVFVPLFAVGLDRSAAESEKGKGIAPDLRDAGELFASSCGGCHTLKAAGTTGAVGPDLDELELDAAKIAAAIERGGRGTGQMPAGILTGEDAQTVAAYVAESAGG